ncbi:MAG: cob(I)yrinic acid a,c-diamide adenosyltransferase [Myxococcota bacterium]|nr:cob(I)yrinic acid a,c-diamide adenosyltransferase [Myxococcota bacterium]
MRITKVYTRGGDKGETSLADGTRVSKNHIRIETYGTVDELNAILGIIRTFLRDSKAPESHVVKLDQMLNIIQNMLFNLGADLATPVSKRWPNMILISPQNISDLEQWIDDLNDSLPPLKEFILPGGGYVGAFFHQARTVCRRAERRCIDLINSDADVGTAGMTYLNRLSDFLFVAGRWTASALDEPEFFWQRDP